MSTRDTATLSSRTMATTTAARTTSPYNASPDEVFAVVARTSGVASMVLAARGERRDRQ